MTSPRCPRCGSDTASAFYSGGWMIDPVRGLVAFKGPALPIRVSWARMLVEVAAANGRPVGMPDLMSAIGTASRGSVKVQLSWLRRYLADNGLPNPIRTVHSRGLAWSAANFSHASEVACV